jgi:hypothetical protein
MRGLSRRRVYPALAAAIGALALTTPEAADAQQRSGMVQGDPSQIRLNADGDPEVQSGARRQRLTGFQLFGNADVAVSSLRTPGEGWFSVTNHGRAADGGNRNARTGDSDPDLTCCTEPHHFRYLELYWSTPPSVRDTIMAKAGVQGSGLEFALGGGFNVRARNSQNGGDNQLPVDGTLGTLHAGASSTTDGSCRDVSSANYGAGNPLLALSDCAETWGSLGWRGRAPVTIDTYLAEARANPTGFTFDFWRFPEGEPAQGTLERQFGSFQTYGIFNDYSVDDLCGTATTRTYGRVIKPAVDACPDVAPTKPGYPLGLEARLDAFLYGIPALKDIGYYQYTIVNKSEEVYGVGIDYDSLYLGIGLGYFPVGGQEAQVYYRPELGAVVASARCSRSDCHGGRNVAEFDVARLTQAGRGVPWEQGNIAMVVLKSPIGDLRNKLFTQAGSPFATVAGIDPELADDTITFNHGHMCGFRACSGTTWATGESNPDHLQRPFGITSSTEINVLGTRPITDPTLGSSNSQVLWHTFRSYDWPQRPAVGSGSGNFPQTGGYNRWVPGTRSGEGPNVGWDWDGDGVQDTLFLDSCSSKSGGQTLATSCAGLFSDTLTNGYLNAYANVGSVVGVGPIRLAAGDTTSFVVAQLGACCGANDADSAITMAKVQAAIDHYLGFYLGPEALPKDTIVAVDVVGGPASVSQVTLTFTETAENVVDPFLLNAAATTAAFTPGSAGEVLLALNPWLADSLRALGFRFGTADTLTGLTATGNFHELYIFKSCNRGTTWTTSADCSPARATGGPFADLGWLPYATLTRDANGDVPNSFTDPNVTGGLTYTYAVVGATRGANFSILSSAAVIDTAIFVDGTDTVTQVVCRAGCVTEVLSFAPRLFNSLGTAGPNVANVYVPVTTPGGSGRPLIAISAPAGFERLTVTPATNRPAAGEFTVAFFDSVVVTVRDSMDVDGRVRLATQSTVVGYRGDTEVQVGTLNAVGGVGLKGGTVVGGMPVDEAFPTHLIRTTTYQFLGLTAVLSSASAPLLVTSEISPTATPESFHSSTAFPGFTIAFSDVTAGTFNAGRGQVWIGPDGQQVGPLVLPYARVTTGSSLIAGAGQGGLYTMEWEDLVYGPAEPFRLNFADPQATRDAVVASLQNRAVAQVGVTDAAAQAATGFTDLVPVKLPFEVRNETFDRPVQVAMRPRANSTILLGSGSDTLSVTVPDDVWIPGDRLIFLEDIDGALQVTFSQFVIECPGTTGTRASCNPVALLTPGATGFIPTLPGTVQSVLWNPELTSAQSFTFTVTPQLTAQELSEACMADPNGAECLALARSIKDVKVVPNPYVVFSGLAQGLVQPLLFTNVPPRGTLRIYTVSGQFVQQITWEEQDLNETGDLLWNLRTRENSIIAGGLYLFMVSGQDLEGRSLGSHMGKFVVIR